METKTRFQRGKADLEGMEPSRSCSDTFDEVLARRIKSRSLLEGSFLCPLF